LTDSEIFAGQIRLTKLFECLINKMILVGDTVVVKLNI
jgi:hypothetical protein